ncbi:abortive infection family protein [Enterococcus faecalis]|uniref:abortive infection family protein n=1 Tax=Enterococcus faecalis TaxID=1351 RepID=UPI00145C2097|nr:abortive infection family protein [Enterococcus faecalis]MDK4408372.1 abortive infection family protein [Enterococcus faecalis]NMP44956.1 abortive infection family protein [Enterococcus faecalis]
MLINSIDRSLVKKVLNNGGYVLDFSNREFDDFTYNSVGIRIQEKYNCSKGRALEQFLDEAEEEKIVRLVLDLINYYKYILVNKVYKSEDKDKQMDYLENVFVEYKKIIEETSSYQLNHKKYLLDKFNSRYLEKQIEFIERSIENSPADAIGKTKELLESCFKYILDDLNIKYSNKDTIQDLRKLVFVELNIDSKENLSAQTNKEIKKILSSLTQIVDGINSLRNEKGVGHGKGKRFKELPTRYAYLVANSASTLVRFVWDTYEFLYLKNI